LLPLGGHSKFPLVLSLGLGWGQSGNFQICARRYSDQCTRTRPKQIFGNIPWSVEIMAMKDRFIYAPSVAGVSRKIGES
jgi:hypothetical protein